MEWPIVALAKSSSTQAQRHSDQGTGGDATCKASHTHRVERQLDSRLGSEAELGVLLPELSAWLPSPEATHPPAYDFIKNRRSVLPSGFPTKFIPFRRLY